VGWLQNITPAVVLQYYLGIDITSAPRPTRFSRKATTVDVQHFINTLTYSLS
jgi:hypothetical protein